MADEDRAGAEGARDEEAAAAAAGGGAWLTYRYRLGGEGTPDAAGTIKAPSFLSAARRILARGLGAAVGPAPAYLRLRAAGEQEVLFRVSRTAPHGGAPLHVEVVPGGTFRFAEADPPAAQREPPPA